MLNVYAQHLQARGRAAGTVALRVTHIRALQRVHPDLMKVSTEDLERELARRRLTHSAESRKSLRASYRVFYAWVTRTGRLVVDPSATLEPVHVPKAIARTAPDEVVQMSLLTADTSLTAMLLLARFGCLRLSEFTTLHMRQREHDLLRIVGKGGKARIVPLNDDLLAVLLTLERELGGDSFYFPGRWGGSMHPQSVNKLITRHTGLNPHSLRHAGATAAYRSTRDLRAVQELLGHSSIATTERYLHIGLDEVRAAAAATAFVSPIRTFPPTTLPMDAHGHLAA